MALIAERTRIRQGEWLAGVSHELRNQLGVMQLATDSLQQFLGCPADAPAPREAIDDCLTVLSNHIDVQSRLVADLMAWARITSGHLTIQRQLVACDALVREEVQALTPWALHLGITLRITAMIAVTVQGDPARLRQVLVNVLQNALKFTPRGGDIAVQLSRQGPMAVLCVEDSAVGFDPGTTETLFGWFWSGSQASIHPSSPANTGVGLALAREIIVQHGGHIRAHSPGPGQGCCVTITLPCTGEIG